MRTSNRSISGVAGLFLGAFGSLSVPTVADADAPRRPVATVGDSRLEATFDQWSDSTTRRASAGLRIARTAMAYRFAVVAIDAAGRRVALPPDWNVSVRGGAAATRALVSLSANTTALDLPRPLGIRLNAADSLDIAASWTDSLAAAVTLVVTIDVDPVDGASSRLAVVPVDVRPALAGTTTREWDLSTTEPGRLLAIAGLPTEGVAAIVLLDVATGATLWQASISSTFGAPRSVARLGVALRHGRTYRVVVTMAADHDVPERSIVAMILPSR